MNMELYHIMIAIKVKCKKKLSCCFHCICCVGLNSTAPGQITYFYMNDSHLYMCSSTLFFSLLLATWEMENIGFDYLLWHQELFQKIIFFEREEERERSFLSLVHYPSTNSWGHVRLKHRTKNSIQVSYIDGKNRSTCAYTCCLPGYSLAENWNRDQSGGSNPGSLIGNLSFLSGMLTAL